MKWLLSILAVVGLSITVGAHRLDEYLQATRLALTLDRITLNVDLTPGVAVVPELLPLIHPAGNGAISRQEQAAYARRIVTDLRLELDGQRQAIKLVRTTFPSRADMETGEGVIHLTAVATIPTLQTGHHEILFRNDHLSKLSVYLVNALVPENPTIQITRQTRDELQTEYRLSFEVKPTANQSGQ